MKKILLILTLSVAACGPKLPMDPVRFQYTVYAANLKLVDRIDKLEERVNKIAPTPTPTVTPTPTPIVK